MEKNSEKKQVTMVDVAGMLEETEKKMRAAASRFKLLREENTALKEQNKSLSLRIDKQQSLIDNQNKTISDLKATLEKGLPRESEWPEGLKSEIERYIEDIDKCLMWLRNS